MQITLNIPEELAAHLDVEQLPYILELGLRQLQATPEAGFEGLTDVLERLGLILPSELAPPGTPKSSSMRSRY